MEREELQLDSESQATWLRGIATRLGESSYVVVPIITVRSPYSQD